MFTGQVERWREPYQPNPAMLRLLLFHEGYDTYQWSERPGAMHGWHFHEEEQLHWVVSGEMEVTVQDCGQSFTYILKNGDRDYIPPKIYHQFRNLGTENLLYLNGIKRKVEPEEEEVEVGKTVAPKAKKAKAAVKVKKAKTTKKTTKSKAASTARKKKL